MPRPKYARNPTPPNCDKGMKVHDAIDGHQCNAEDLVVNADGYKVDSRDKRTWDERYDLEGDRPFTPNVIGSGITFANGDTTLGG